MRWGSDHARLRTCEVEPAWNVAQGWRARASEDPIPSQALRESNSHVRAQAQHSVTTHIRIPSQTITSPEVATNSHWGFPAMESLSIWLLFVGFCRLSAVYFGFFNVWALRLAVFSKLKAMQDVHGRTFGVWTLLTCLLCVVTAFNLDNEELYLVTFLSFVFALGYFLLECFVYRTMAVKNVASLFFFAGGSIIWMSLEWNKHHGKAIKHVD